MKLPQPVISVISYQLSVISKRFIENLSILEGKLTPIILGLVIEWAAIHQRELLENWQRAREQNPLEKIEPLE